MSMAVKKFPQYLVKLNKENKKDYYRTESYLLYLEEIEIESIIERNIYVEMVESMLQYLYNKYNHNKEDKS